MRSLNPAFRFIGTYRVFDSVQLPIVILILTFVVFYFIMKYTKLGRNVYAVGANPEAAHICGINVARIKIFCFVTIGGLSSIAGMLFTARISSASPTVGAMFALDSIAACVVGGTAMTGGKGSLGGVFMGVMIVNVVQNGLVMIGLDASYHYIATGLIMFGAVLAQSRRQKV